MKVRYEKPKMNVMEMAPCLLFAASTLSINAYSQGDLEEDFARDRRGTWGDLWEEKESIQ